MGITLINHLPTYYIDSWYKPFLNGWFIIVPTLDDLRLATGALPDMLTRFAHFLSAHYSYAQA